MVRSFRWNGRKHYRTGSSRERHDQASRTASAETAVDAHAHDLEHRIRQLIADIDTRVERVRKGVWLIDRRLDAALREQDQATTNLSHLGLAGIPRQTATPAHAPPPPPANTKAKSGKKRGSRICPRCGKPMVERWGAPVNGKPALFLGCSAYPTCSGTSSVRYKIGVP